MSQLSRFFATSGPGSNVESLTGNIGGPVFSTAGNINVIGDGVKTLVTGNPGTSTLTITLVGSGVVETLTGDTGGAVSPTAGNINVITNRAANANGASFRVDGTPGTSTLTVNTTDANNNVFFGKGTGNTTLSGGNNDAFGVNCCPALTTGQFNFAMGTGALQAVTSGVQNGAFGNAALLTLTTGQNNYAMGFVALPACVTGNDNMAFGSAALEHLGNGSGNLCIGNQAGNNYAGVESNNIVLGRLNLGTLGESNVLRIGNGTGVAAGNLAKAFISGIDGVNVGSVAKVVTMASDQLGTATITAGTGISIVPGANTITINGIGGGLTWTVIAVNQTAAINNGYFCNKAGTLALALPATSAVGDVIEVSNINTALGVQFTQAAGQQIFIGNTSTTLGATGTLTSSAVGDALKIVCSAANTTWRVVSGWGNWTPA